MFEPLNVFPSGSSVTLARKVAVPNRVPCPSATSPTKVTIAESDPVDDQAPCAELEKSTSPGAPGHGITGAMEATMVPSASMVPRERLGGPWAKETITCQDPTKP